MLGKKAQEIVDVAQMVAKGVDSWRDAMEKYREFLGKHNAFGKRSLVVGAWADLAQVLRSFDSLKATPR